MHIYSHSTTGGVFFPFHCKQGEETTACTIQVYSIYSVPVHVPVKYFRTFEVESYVATVVKLEFENSK